jgi:hypothetical protein
MPSGTEKDGRSLAGCALCLVNGLLEDAELVEKG